MKVEDGSLQNSFLLIFRVIFHWTMIMGERKKWPLQISREQLQLMSAAYDAVAKQKHGTFQPIGLVIFQHGEVVDSLIHGARPKKNTPRISKISSNLKDLRDIQLVGGLNPFEKYYPKWESSPNRGENKKYLKPPPRERLENINETLVALDLLVGMPGGSMLVVETWDQCL